MDQEKRVLVIEDDATIALGLQSALSGSGYAVRTAVSGEDGLRQLQEDGAELVLLDWMLPGKDGPEILQVIKQEHPSTQVIMLTARGEELDRVMGLELGADDYVSKPFSLMELLARVKARLRSPIRVEGSEGPSDSLVQLGDRVLNLRLRRLSGEDGDLELTTHEARVLEYLMQHPGEDVSREALLEHVWGYSRNMTTRTVDNQILKLRKKIEPVPSRPRFILTVHGTGYRFEP